jgi:predicted HAD superfamily phosphohydrolase YqeG
MNVIDNENIVCVDVDDTIVYWNTPADPDGKLKYFDIETKNGMEVMAVNESTIRDINRHYLQGHYIIVWSQSGKDWAKAVCDSLGITKKVSAVMSKPKWYIDDLPADEWMTRIKK